MYHRVPKLTEIPNKLIKKFVRYLGEKRKCRLSFAVKYLGSYYFSKPDALSKVISFIENKIKFREVVFIFHLSRFYMVPFKSLLRVQIKGASFIQLWYKFLKELRIIKLSILIIITICILCSTPLTILLIMILLLFFRKEYEHNISLEQYWRIDWILLSWRNFSVTSWLCFIFVRSNFWLSRWKTRSRKKLVWFSNQRPYELTILEFVRMGTDTDHCNR